MRPRLFVLWVLLLVFCSRAFAGGEISERLQEALDQASETNDPVRTIVMLSDQVDVNDLSKELYSQEATLQLRAFTIITALQEKAASTQGNLLGILESRSSSEVLQFESYWVVNAIFVEAVPNAIYQLAEELEVDYIDLDAELQWDEPVTRGPATEVIPNGVEPGLRAINADAMWAAGYTGTGVIVMNIDTGVDVNHPALGYKWRGNQPGVPASAAWIDPGGGTTMPNDCDDHGTHTIGIMNGLDPATNDTIGVAPGAQWIAAKTICSSPHTSNTLAAFQWAMDPDGNPGTSDDMPVGIGNSYFDPNVGFCDATYQAMYDAVEASGIGVVFSAGNSGPGSGSITTPKNHNADLVNTFATGALDANNNIASFSSRGPSQCVTGDFRLDTKPEASAPGVSVRSSVIGGGYSNFSGTSMACPHVVGAMALLREAHPNKTGYELKLALYETASDLGTPGEDNTFGMGIIDVFAAHLSLADPEDPNDPDGFTAYSDFTTPASVLLTWTDPTTLVNGDSLTNFQIDVWRDGDSLTSVASGTETYTDDNSALDGTGLNDGQLYMYTILTRDLNTDSLSSGVDAEAYAGGSPTPAAPANLVCVADTVSALLTWDDPTTQSDGTPLDDLDKLYIYRTGVLIDSVSPGTETYTDFPPVGFTYEYTVRAIDDEIPTNLSAPSNAVVCFVGTTPNFLVWVGPNAGGQSPQSGDSIFAALVANGESVILSGNLFEFGSDLSIYEGVFVVLGIFANNHVLAANGPEALALETFLQGGGRIFIEGGDCFNYDPDLGGGHNIRPWFGLDPGNDGSGDLSGVIGLNDLSAFTFSYSGENNWMDELVPSTSTAIWQNDANSDLSGVFAVGFGGGSGRAVGVVPSFGGFDNSMAPLNFIQRTTPEATGNEGSIANRFKPRPQGAKSFPVVTKAAYYPELRKTRTGILKLVKVTASGVEILANNKVDLMAAYLGLFRDLGAPVIQVEPMAVTDTLFIGASSMETITVSNNAGSLGLDLNVSVSENPSQDWISVSPLSDTIETNTSADFVVSLDAAGLSAGLFSTTLEFASNDTSNPLVEVTVNLTVEELPVITLSDTLIMNQVELGDTSTTTMFIHNDGLTDLTFDIEEGEVPFGTAGSGSGREAWMGLTTPKNAGVDDYVLKSRTGKVPVDVSSRNKELEGGIVQSKNMDSPSKVSSESGDVSEKGQPSVNNSTSQETAFGGGNEILAPLDWVEASPTSGTVTAGDSVEITIDWFGVIPSEEIREGYFGIMSNDPLTPVSNVHLVLDVVTGIGDLTESLIPDDYDLHQNFPNPFNPKTTIKYDLPESGKVEVKIYNILGQEVRTLVNTRQEAGFQTIQWDGKDNAGRTVSSGIYVYRLVAGKYVSSKKMMFLK